MSRIDRRALLRYLAATPLAALVPPARSADRADLPGSAADALDVFDLEAVAHDALPPAHWGYLQSGVDGDATLRANEAAFARYQLRGRRLIDVSHVDLSIRLFGARFDSPVFCCPIGSLRALHPDGEVAVARGAKAAGALQILSTQTSLPLEAVAAARGAPIWYQLYTTNRFEVTRRLLRRAESAGCPVVAVTLDLPAGRNTVTAARLRRADSRDCSACHSVDARGNPRLDLASEPMFAGIDTHGLALTAPTLTWDFVKRLKDATTMKVVLKGIEAREDAELAVEHGADGIIVSNHGGRALESGRGTLESLPDVLAGAAGRIPVLMDGGVRRGTDVYKALALGASAVGIGRPYGWGLAAFGEAGVERALKILNLELRLAMVGCGARSVGEIGHDSLIDRERVS
ncbi:MAG TPA: alpha-hydroxy acid oxidase [Steroidobacteraceae bacterium]|nr:alpha-hydroxy acid oxidase [Steroidobacteraceae bacterium]